MDGHLAEYINIWAGTDRRMVGRMQGRREGRSDRWMDRMREGEVEG